ncbi:MAG: 2-amino-4-hydroxy-6-hydroxymethyldihydropteridine diphosphokinase [Myxococcota bacterium]
MEADMLTVAVALGANLGDPPATLRWARAELITHLPSLGARGLRFSRLWRTEPVGPPQPRYLNAALAFQAPSTTDPLALLALLHDLERRAGRVRAERWGPRVLDLDLITVGALRCALPNLTLPHPHAHERPFVLWPLLDAWPEAWLPVVGAVRPLATALGRQGALPITPDDNWDRLDPDPLP